jgi:hypothetical protein
VHVVQVRQLDFVPLLLKRLHGHLDELAGQRCVFGMRMDDQNILPHCFTLHLMLLVQKEPASAFHLSEGEAIHGTANR